jgi:hypothetical protein
MKKLIAQPLPILVTIIMIVFKLCNFLNKILKEIKNIASYFNFSNLKGGQKESC